MSGSIEPDAEWSPDVEWSVAEAKAKLSDLLASVAADGPQVITKHGREVAVVASIDAWRHRIKRTGSLAEFLAESPLRDADLEVDRIGGPMRDADLT